MRRREGAFAGDVADIEAYYRQGIQQLPLALQGAEMPVIAAVNGPAIGAGCDLACMCDLRIGSSRTVFGETFVNLGIVPGDGGAWFLQRLLGHQRAAEMTFTGRLIEADEALTIGLLLKVVKPEALMDSTLELARTMAAKPPQALRYAKRLMKKAERMELADYLDLSAVWQGVCHKTDDHMEAVSAFIDKRPPVFKRPPE
jgi:enoyl-CoA hydratase/carnithine racemase